MILDTLSGTEKISIALLLKEVAGASGKLGFAVSRQKLATLKIETLL